MKKKSKNPFHSQKSESQVEETEVIQEEDIPEDNEPETPVEEKSDAKENKEKDTAASKAEEELKAQNDKYLRLVAEYDNFRKRSQKERESLYSDIKSSVLLSFLPVFDNLERALSAPTADEAYRKGVEMIMTQFCNTMKQLGIEEIPALGQQFDPKLHNAVMHVDDEEKGENEIVEVFQQGFAIGDKVIRPSMVKVAN